VHQIASFSVIGQINRQAADFSATAADDMVIT
jgi:hypothetical protein